MPNSWTGALPVGTALEGDALEHRHLVGQQRLHLLDAAGLANPLETVGGAGQRIVQGVLAAGDSRNRVVHHGHQRGDLLALLGGADAGVSRDAARRLEAGLGQRVQHVRAGPGRELGAALADRRDRLGDWNRVASGGQHGGDGGKGVVQGVVKGCADWPWRLHGGRGLDRPLAKVKRDDSVSHDC